MPQVNDFDMSKYAHDFSGYVRAAEMRAQSMANIGQQIGAGITAFDEKRKEKKKKSNKSSTVLIKAITTTTYVTRMRKILLISKKEQKNY